METDRQQLAQFREYREAQEWDAYVKETSPKFVEKMGDEYFPVICRLLEGQRKGIFSKDVVRQIFTEALYEGEPT